MGERLLKYMSRISLGNFYKILLSGLQVVLVGLLEMPQLPVFSRP